VANRFYREKFLRPELFLADIVRKGSQGLYREVDEYQPFLQRALVLAVDTLGGQLENPDGAKSGKSVSHTVDGNSYTFDAVCGPANPRNSIKARIISDGFDQFIHDDNLRVFWPLFPEHVAVPLKPGEHCYVLFEDENREHGLWVSKVPGHENVNYFQGQSSFTTGNENSLPALYPGGQSTGNDDRPTNTDASAAESYDLDLASMLPS
jgi:hypothetical protein